MFYTKDEPLNNYLDLGDCPELEEWSSESIGDTYSFKAINPAGQIIGIIINGVVHKNVGIWCLQRRFWLKINGDL